MSQCEEVKGDIIPNQKKKSQSQNGDWLMYDVNKYLFTNNVSWLGDPRL